MRKIKLIKMETGWKAQFYAMACPCEVLMETEDQCLARKLGKNIAQEAWRIEDKFSRYRQDNIVYKINHAAGQPLALDKETTALIGFADELYNLSEEMFDITSGILRQVWTFDGSNHIPSQKTIKPLLKHIGWHKVKWKPPVLILMEGMEIDLGGLAKEYAVDCCVQIARTLCSESVLVNLGGDLAVTWARKNHACWSVGRLITGCDEAVAMFKLYTGAIATSGDAHRYLLKDGVRLSHVLNPKTGWPVENPPHTVSVAAPTCLEAGMMSTLALLQGGKADAFLKLQEVEYWIN